MLEVKNLSTYFHLDSSIVKAVDNISFKIEKDETLGLLGESGSGKSTVGLSILRLVPSPGRVESGEIILDGVDLLKLKEEDKMINVRGGKISMIFQDPFSSLNPVFKIGEQIEETIRLHQGISGRFAREKTKEMLDLVKIDPQRINNYPHQFSGGMRQRVMIAMALSCRPEYLIADEPTTALDAKTESEILGLIKKLQQKLGFGMIFITHNFRIAKGVCEKFAVMQNGKIVEKGPNVFDNPRDPYTQKLVSAMRKLYG